MLIPSIDLMGGRVVQLVHGERLALGFDDLDYWIERFSAYPMVQLIDLDAAKRQGQNHALLERIVTRLPCQVGGGLRSVQDAQRLLAMGARKAIFGSSLFQETGVQSADAPRGNPVRLDFAESLASSIGIERLVFSVDTRNGMVAVHGWKHLLALRPEEAMRDLEPYCGAFLYTHIDTEGTMRGFPLEVARSLRETTRRQLIVAGGIRSQAEIDALDALRVDAVAGMAIYTGVMQA